MSTINEAIAQAQWKMGPNMPMYKMQQGVAVAGGKIYNLSGLGGNSGVQTELTNTICIYHPGNNSWTTGPSIPVGAYYYNAVAHGTKIYGADSHGSLGNEGHLDVWDTASNTWEKKRYPNVNMGDQAVTIGNAIYFTCYGNNSNYKYDIEKNTWHKLPGTEYNFCAAAAVGDKVYGGVWDPLEKKGSILALDIHSETWEYLGATPFDLHAYRMASVGPYVIVAGRAPATKDENGSRECYAFDTRSKQWIKMGNINVGRYSHGMTAVGNRLYIFGGGLGAGKGITNTMEYLDFPEIGEDPYTIAEHYVNEGREALTLGVEKTVQPGEEYTATAPAIAGYSCFAHQIDAAPTQTGATVRIPAVQQNHEVTFVYRKESGGEIPGSCCCCTKVKIQVETCAGNRELLGKLCRALEEEACHSGCELEL